MLHPPGPGLGPTSWAFLTCYQAVATGERGQHEPRKEFMTTYIFPLELQEDTVSCLPPAQPERTCVSLSPHPP